MSGKISVAFPQPRIGCCRFVLSDGCTAKHLEKEESTKEEGV